MSDKICAKCGVGWVIQADDKHCGYCGCAVFDFAVNWEKQPLLYAGNTTDIHELTILVQNTGAYSVQFDPIQTDNGSIIKFLQPNKDLFEVKAGEEELIPIQLNSENLVEHTEYINVRAKEAPPDAEREKSLKLQVYPTPDFELTPSKIDISHRKDEEKVTRNIHLEVLRSQFQIKSISCSPHWVKPNVFPTELCKKDSAAKKVSLDIICKELNDENTVTLEFELHGYSNNIQKQIDIHREVLPDPPKLFVQPRQLQVTQNREVNDFLTLQNKGESELTIHEITFDDPANIIIHLQNVEYPINIEGSKHQNVDISIAAKDVDPKSYNINWTIHSNCNDKREYQGSLNIKVNERKDYRDYLAIDFGTTNSCCAYVGPADEPKLIPLDDEANSLSSYIMPSTIIYQSRHINGKAYKVGYDAETERTSEIDGPYYISSVKRWLGYEWERLFPNGKPLQPRDVVADLLRYIIEQVENHLDTETTESKIKRCVITHPTMFMTKQREDLKQAFNKIGITDVKLIDEASAATLGAISQLRKNNKNLQKNHRLLVYDFGGGTIDIALSQVTIDGNHIKIEPLTHGGNPRYGGDDVTQAIVNFALSEFEKRIKKENPNLDYDIPYMSPRKIVQPSGNPDFDRAAQTNTPILYNRAEAMKKELSEKEKVNNDFPLSVVVGNGVHLLEEYTENNINVELSVQQLQSFIETELKETFDDIDNMIADNGEQLPDLVVLAGQSSKMPMVEDMLAAHFQTKYDKDVNIYLSNSPKECVAIGAAIYGMTKSTVSKDTIEIINPPKTYSRLGIKLSDGGRFVFSEIIPKGKLIPEQSLGKMDISLDHGDINFDVFEHFGSDNEIKNASLINKYTLNLSEDIEIEKLQNTNLQMAVEDNGDIKVAALAGDKEYEFIVQKKNPEFVKKEI